MYHSYIELTAFVVWESSISVPNDMQIVSFVLSNNVDTGLWRKVTGGCFQSVQNPKWSGEVEY